MRLFNTSELSLVLQIKSTTINELVSKGKIPYTRIPTLNGEEIRFVPQKIKDWLRSRPNINMEDNKYLNRFKTTINKESHLTIKKLKEIDKQFTEKKEAKGYYLWWRKDVYYAIYVKDGKKVPTKRSTYTNNRETAERWAMENRDRVLAEYYNRDNIKKLYDDLYIVLKKYYALGSPYIEIDSKRGRELSERTRNEYHNFVKNQFIPFLRKNKINNFNEINTPLLYKFQNYLLLDKKKNKKTIVGLKPQSINKRMCYIRPIFDQLLQEGEIKLNPFTNLKALVVKDKDRKVTGCYEINKLKGVFNRRWKDELTYMLNLLIYTTDMRNCEIEGIQVKDLFKINNINFLNITASKTINGIRIIPLHDFVYRKIKNMIKKQNLKSNDFLFKINNHDIYNKAKLDLASYTGYSLEKLNAENIKFYSGRHFWKTLMNSENLGEIEEFFMGHKVKSDVAKNYNHKDKQGRKKLLERARRVFQILDKYVFKT